ncbi:CLUMA_CG007362, isoform A [Clunio marinus]|uniref:CLUMA_CG007362, isoform A n=1 Tax=Clunio marinus TaxID=568069 RepID=A0A1J1I0V7_9DIPT|nr:CLUMA_CG007362, isoform A [Clunio marinus]
MSEVNLMDLVYSDTFCEIQCFLRISDLFTLRCVSKDLRNYIDNELIKLKRLTVPARNEKAITAFQVVSEKCENLETINLNRNEWLTDECLVKLLNKNSKTLVNLSLNNCVNLTSIVLQPVIISCRKLKKLSLQSCYWLTIGCLETIAFHRTDLENLDLSKCKMISERCLIVILNNFRKLKTLSLASVTNVNDNVLFNISKRLTEIEHLNLFGCLLVTDRGIGALSLNCKKLETLSIRGCGDVTERSLNLLRSRNVHIDIPRNPINLFINNLQRMDRNDYMYLQV